MSEEKTHYTKAELVEFKELILKKLAESKEEYKGLQDSLKDSTDNGADAFNFTEMGTEIADKEHAEMMMARIGKFIDSLERALIRIENGSYGRCKVTGKLIPKERLRVVPHTETSLEAKMNPNA